MSVKRIAYHSVKIANNKLGGAFATRSTRSRHGQEFIDFCRQDKQPITDIKQITPALLKAWIENLKLSGCSVATQNNKVASVRSLAKARDADLKATGIDDSQALGLEQRSRIGKKSPITDELFNSAVAEALVLGEDGFAHALKLERYLGLRGLEALMSTSALKTYAKQARYIMDQGMSAIHIQDGTKGGRPRDVAVIAQFAAETFKVIVDALNYAVKHQGFLIMGKPGSGLGGARKKYHYLATKVGLIGEFSPHSLRYRYCIDKLMEMNAAGVPRNEALAFASACLGHGPSRTRFISTVYGKTVTHLLPKTTRKQNITKVIADLEKFIAS